VVAIVVLVLVATVCGWYWLSDVMILMMVMMVWMLVFGLLQPFDPLQRWVHC